MLCGPLGQNLPVLLVIKGKIVELAVLRSFPYLTALIRHASYLARGKIVVRLFRSQEETRMLFRIDGRIAQNFEDADSCMGFPSWYGWVSKEDQFALWAIQRIGNPPGLPGADGVQFADAGWLSPAWCLANVFDQGGEENPGERRNLWQ